MGISISDIGQIDKSSKYNMKFYNVNQIQLSLTNIQELEIQQSQSIWSGTRSNKIISKPVDQRILCKKLKFCRQQNKLPNKIT